MLHQLSMVDYETMKLRLLMTTALLTAGGSGVAALAAGADAAVPFAIGGVAGLLYQWLLQLGADAAVAQAAAAAGSSPSSSGSGSVAAAVSSFSAAAARSRGTRVPAAPVAPAFGMEAAAEQQPGFQDRMLGVFGSSAFRLLLLTGAAVAAVSALQDGSPAGGCRMYAPPSPRPSAAVCMRLNATPAGCCWQPVRSSVASCPEHRRCSL